MLLYQILIQTSCKYIKMLNLTLTQDITTIISVSFSPLSFERMSIQNFNSDTVFTYFRYIFELEIKYAQHLVYLYTKEIYYSESEVFSETRYLLLYCFSTPNTFYIDFILEVVLCHFVLIATIEFFQLRFLVYHKTLFMLFTVYIS